MMKMVSMSRWAGLAARLQVLTLVLLTASWVNLWTGYSAHGSSLHPEPSHPQPPEQPPEHPPEDPQPPLRWDWLRCQSYGHVHYCIVYDREAMRIEQVRLYRELSHRRCYEGRSWGFTDWYVWVRHGCAADFKVLIRDLPPPHPTPHPYPPGY